MRMTTIKNCMARVFSAIDIEEPEVLKELEHVRDSIDLGFNTVPKEKMHITLQFFEDVNPEQLREIKEAMDCISVQPFPAEIRGLGVFPSKDYIRVIWAGVESESIHRLYHQVSGHGTESSNNHDFKPHITLARVKNLSPGKKKKLQKSLEEFSEHEFGNLKIDKTRLFESKVTGNNTRYNIIHEKEL